MNLFMAILFDTCAACRQAERLPNCTYCEQCQEAYLDMLDESERLSNGVA